MMQSPQPPIAEPLQSRRRWYRYSMRGLLAFITIVACILGWIVKEQRQSEIERQVGIKFQYDQQNEFGEPLTSMVYLGPYDSLELHKKKKPQGWWRELARYLLGERVYEVHISSSVSSSDFPLIARLKYLEELSLDTTSASNLIPLSGLENLKKLHLYNRGYGCDLIPLSELRNLEWLILSATSDEDLTPLAGLKSLKSLQVTSSSVSDLTPLLGLKNLVLLDLSHSSSVDDLSPISGLLQLEELNLKGTSVTNLTPIAGLKNLKVLHLGLVSELAPLAGLKGLKELYVSGTSSIDEQVNSLQQILPDCTIKR